MDAAQVYALARSVGLPHRRAVVATAIAGAESGYDPGAVGDVGLADDSWGPSVGLWQVRSLRAQQGTGGPRDASRLADAGFNARSMFQISHGGRDWSPWSTYNDGSYAGYLDDARTAAGDGSSGAAGAPTDPAGSSYSDATPVGGVLNPGGTLFDLFGLDSADQLRSVAITGAVLVGAVALILVGTSSTLQLQKHAPGVLGGAA